MARFEQALAAIRTGRKIKNPHSLNRWIYLDSKKNRLVHETSDFDGVLQWLPNQFDILSEDWIIK